MEVVPSSLSHSILISKSVPLLLSDKVLNGTSTDGESLTPSPFHGLLIGSPCDNSVDNVHLDDIEDIECTEEVDDNSKIIIDNNLDKIIMNDLNII